VASFSDVIVTNAGGIGTGTPGQLAYFSGVNVVSGAGGTILTATGALTVASLAIGVTGSGFSSGGALTATSGTFSLPSAVNSTLVMGGVAFGNVLAGIAFVQNTTSGTAAGSALYFGNDTGASGVGYVAGYSSVHSTKPSYLEIMNTQNAPVTIGTNGVVRMTIAAAGGVTIPLTLGVTGNLTIGASTFVVTAATGAVNCGALTAATGTFAAPSASSLTALTVQTPAVVDGYVGITIQNAGTDATIGVSRSTGSDFFTGSQPNALAIGTQNATPINFGTNGVLRGYVTGAGALTWSYPVTLSSTLQVGSLGAFVAGDKYVIADSSGNFHLSALGPVS